jgi:hypothetical protein
MVWVLRRTSLSRGRRKRRRESASTSTPDNAPTAPHMLIIKEGRCCSLGKAAEPGATQHATRRDSCDSHHDRGHAP